MGVKILSKEIIEAIRKTEADAKKEKSAAAQKAKKIIIEASEEAKKNYEASVASSVCDMEEKLELIKEQCENLLEKNRAEALAEAEKETNAAMEHMDDAVAIIIGELTKNVGK